MMRRRWMFFLAPPAFVLFVFLFGEVVTQLWNWLMPQLFGWHTISYWQGLGLLVLCRILFGGFGHHGGHRRDFRRHMGEHWDRMSPEDRERFIQGMRHRWGGFCEPGRREQGSGVAPEATRSAPGPSL